MKINIAEHLYYILRLTDINSGKIKRNIDVLLLNGSIIFR